MNKKYTIGDYTNCRYDICMVLCDGEWILTVATKDADKIISLLEENEQLKQFIQSLAEQSVNGKVMLKDGRVYDLNKILKKGDVE